MPNAEFIATAKELILNLLLRVDAAIPMLREGDGGTFITKLVFIAEDFQTLADALHLINEQEENNSYNLDEFNEMLGMLLIQIEHQNYLMASDYIEFELKPLLVHWSETLTYVH
jgi:hypothetical protein